VKKLLRLLTAIDFILAGALLGWGILKGSWFYGLSGGIGLVIASFKPAQRIHARLEKLIERRESKKVHNDIGLVQKADEFYTESVVHSGADEPPRVSRVTIDPRPGNLLQSNPNKAYSEQEVLKHHVF
jgi:hypothetical protein